MCGVLVAPGTMAHKSDQDPPLRLNSLDCFMITKAARKYERRGVITLCAEGEGGMVGVVRGFDLLKEPEDVTKTQTRKPC